MATTCQQLTTYPITEAKPKSTPEFRQNDRTDMINIAGTEKPVSSMVFLDKINSNGQKYSHPELLAETSRLKHLNL